MDQAQWDRQANFLLQSAVRNEEAIAKLIDARMKNELMLADLMMAVMAHERRISSLEKPQS